MPEAQHGQNSRGDLGGGQRSPVSQSSGGWATHLQLPSLTPSLRKGAVNGAVSPPPSTHTRECPEMEPMNPLRGSICCSQLTHRASGQELCKGPAGPPQRGGGKGREGQHALGEAVGLALLPLQPKEPSGNFSTLVGHPEPYLDQPPRQFVLEAWGLFSGEAAGPPGSLPAPWGPESARNGECTAKPGEHPVPSPPQD